MQRIACGPAGLTHTPDSALTCTAAPAPLHSHSDDLEDEESEDDPDGTSTSKGAAMGQLAGLKAPAGKPTKRRRRVRSGRQQELNRLAQQRYRWVKGLMAFQVVPWVMQERGQCACCGLAWATARAYAATPASSGHPLMPSPCLHAHMQGAQEAEGRRPSDLRG